MPLSQQFYLTISSIPLFVWPLFAILVFIGLRASKTRTMPIAMYYGLPFIGLAVVPTLMRIGFSVHTFATFLVAYSLGALIGFSVQKNLIETVDSRRVSVKGEWVTMGTVMTIFFSNFVLGTLNAVKPELAENLIFITAFLTVIGLCSGMFLGRSLQVIRFSRALTA